MVGEPQAQYYPVTAESVRNLAAFLRATGWTCLDGIGMGTNTPKRAAGRRSNSGVSVRLRAEDSGWTADLEVL